MTKGKKAGVWISPDFFEVNLKLSDWPEDVELRSGVNWLLAFLEPEDWKRRRFATLQRFLDSASGESAREASDKGRFFDERDQFAWYLFLAQAFLDHPTIYDFTFGCRILPVFRAIGRSVKLLRSVKGIDTRVQRMIGPEKGQPNACLFELLVAIAYVQRGATVSFLEERPGVAKTHDMDVVLDDVAWAVECKRMEVSEYGEKERAISRELWMPLAQSFYKRGLDVICTVDFLVEMHLVPKTYLFSKASQWLEGGGLVPVTWSDLLSVGRIQRLDLSPLREVLKTDDVAMNSSRLHELLTGAYKRNAHIITALRVLRADNPLYLAECDTGTVFDWDSRSIGSVDGKARDVLKRLSDATKQLPDGRSCIVHIGLEAVDGMDVERARYEKVINSIGNFDPGTKQLEYVYVTWFAPECPPNNQGAFDETCHWQAVRKLHPRPLAEGLLFLSPEVPSREGVHWE